MDFAGLRWSCITTNCSSASPIFPAGLFRDAESVLATDGQTRTTTPPLQRHPTSTVYRSLGFCDRQTVQVPPCQKPLKMLEHIILTSTREGDTVLDCFGGLMMLAQACREHGRRFIEIEIEKGGCEVAVNHLVQRTFGY